MRSSAAEFEATGISSVASVPRRSARLRPLVPVLVLAHGVGLAAAFFSAQALTGSHSPVAVACFVGILPVWLLTGKLLGLYRLQRVRFSGSGAEGLSSSFQFVTIGSWFLLALLAAAGAEDDLRGLFAFWGLSMITVPITRAAARALVRRRSDWPQKTVILGAGDVGQLMARKLLQHPEYGIELLGFVDSDPRVMRKDIPRPLLGGPADLRAIVGELNVDRVIVAFSRDRHEEVLDLLHSLRTLNVQVDVIPRLYEALGPTVDVHSIEGLPLVCVETTMHSWAGQVAKRLLDVVGATAALALAAPVMLAIALLIRRDSPGPIFYRQVRVGRDLREFTLLKFRSMRVDTDERPHQEYIQQISSWKAELGENNLYKLERKDAVTRCGRWLRRTSLDELPQLINVLRGEMSLVGPRPCLSYELKVLEPRHFERFRVLPGITGLWQVTGRGSMTFREALDADVVYAFTRSFVLDVRLLLRTPVALLRQKSTA